MNGRSENESAKNNSKGAFQMQNTKAPYPKSPNDIKIRVTQRGLDEGMMSGVLKTDEMALADKLKDYVMRLGYSSAHITGVVVQLLTKGKVRIDFRDYVERLELLDPSDRLSSPQAMTLLDDFIEQARAADSHGAEHPDKKKITTQKIVVQFPRGGG